MKAKRPHLSLLKLLFFACCLTAATRGFSAEPPTETLYNSTPGNPVFPGWYADPEAAIFDKQYWIYPTYSAGYERQTYFDAFSSPDLVHWTKHPNIVDKTMITWARRAMWAPAISRNHGRYFFIFAANDIQHDGESGGLGVAVADAPGGPFKDYLGNPLIDKYYNGAQPIDPFVFADTDGQHYLIYGGHSHCNIGKLKDDYTGFIPLPDGQPFKEITPKGYVEGSVMFKRNGKYYFMWSEGRWTDASYNIAYAIGDSPMGPFEPKGKVILPDPAIATGAGHHSVIQLPGQDRWFIVYHRHPPGEKDGNSRVTCIEKMSFNPDGTIQPVKMTNEGVGINLLP